MNKEYLRTWEISWFVNPKVIVNDGTISVSTKNKTIHFYHNSNDKEIDRDEVRNYASKKFNIHSEKFLFIKEVK